MKKLFFSRKAILRAIRAACIALYFAAAAQAKAQALTGDGSGNVILSSTTTSSYALSPTSSPPLASSGTLTIESTGGINFSTTSSSGYAIQVGTPVTVTNSGYLDVNNNSTSPGTFISALDVKPLSTPGDLTITNDGSGSGLGFNASTSGGSVTGVTIQNVEQGSISITNSSYITASSNSGYHAQTGSALYAQDTSATGSITLTNYGSINASGSFLQLDAVILKSSASGGINVNSSAGLYVTATLPNGDASTVSALDLTSTGSGPITVTNSGMITALVNSNQDGPRAAALDLTSTSSGNMTVTNNGEIETTSGYNMGTIGVDILANSSGSGNVSITSSGSDAYIFAGNAGAGTTGGTSATGIEVNSSSSGYVTVTNNSPITIVASTTAASAIEVNETGNGNVTVMNVPGPGTLATISSIGEAGTANGIQVSDSGSGYVSITNSGSITASASGTATGLVVNETGSGNIVITNDPGGTIMATSSGSNAIGIAGSASDSNDVTISNGGTLDPSSNSRAPVGTATGISATTVDGDISITNTGTISPSSYLQTTGIAATATGNGNILVTNSGYLQGVFTGSSNSSAPVPTYGICINAAGSGTVTVNNSGAIHTNSGYYAEGIYVKDTGTGAISITNTSGGTITTGSGQYAIPSTGIEVLGSDSNDVTINNAAAITVTGSGITEGILSQVAAGTTSITNSGMISTGGALNYGINASGQGNITITNETGGTISGSFYGIMANASAGTAQVTNSGSITTTAPGNTQGISASGTSVTVSNYASISAYTFANFTPSQPIAAILATASSGSVTVNNSGTLNAYYPTGSLSGTYPVSYGINANGPGAITITNNSGGTIGNSVTTTNSPNYGIVANSTGGPVQVTNNANISTFSAVNTQTFMQTNAQGITASGSSVNILNTGTISAYASGSSMTPSAPIATDIAASSTSGVSSLTVNNSGNLITASNTGYSEGFGIHLTSPGTVTNSGYIQAQTTGIMLDDEGTVTNSGTITISGMTYSSGTGIEAGTIGGAGNVTVTNNVGGDISSTDSGSGSEGIYVTTTTGTVQVTNHANIRLSCSSYGEAVGISASGPATVTVNNTGTISTYSSQGASFAIFASSNSGPLTVTNSGYLHATRSSSNSNYAIGIWLLSAGSVTNSGNITASDYAMKMPSGSHLTLQGAPVILGRILGGEPQSNTSTSLLTFNLTVPTAELSADEAELNSEIMTYDDNDGGEMTFNIGELSYDIDDFSYAPGDITDDLQPTDTPEPATWLSIIGGLAGLAFVRRRKKQPVPVSTE